MEKDIINKLIGNIEFLHKTRPISAKEKDFLIDNICTVFNRLIKKQKEYEQKRCYSCKHSMFRNNQYFCSNDENGLMIRDEHNETMIWTVDEIFGCVRWESK